MISLSNLLDVTAYWVLLINSFITEVPIKQKSVHWFAEQIISGLVSMSKPMEWFL